MPISLHKQQCHSVDLAARGPPSRTRLAQRKRERTKNVYNFFPNGFIFVGNNDCSPSSLTWSVERRRLTKEVKLACKLAKVSKCNCTTKQIRLYTYWKTIPISCPGTWIYVVYLFWRFSCWARQLQTEMGECKKKMTQKNWKNETWRCLRWLDAPHYELSILASLCALSSC